MIKDLLISINKYNDNMASGIQIIKLWNYIAIYKWLIIDVHNPYHLLYLYDIYLIIVSMDFKGKY